MYDFSYKPDNKYLKQKSLSTKIKKAGAAALGLVGLAIGAGAAYEAIKVVTAPKIQYTARSGDSIYNLAQDQNLNKLERVLFTEVFIDANMRSQMGPDAKLIEGESYSLPVVNPDDLLEKRKDLVDDYLLRQ